MDKSDTWQQTATWKASIAASIGGASLTAVSKASQKSHSCGRLCDQSPAVICITSNWGGKESSALDRAWAYMYPGKCRLKITRGHYIHPFMQNFVSTNSSALS